MEESVKFEEVDLIALDKEDELEIRFQG